MKRKVILKKQRVIEDVIAEPKEIIYEIRTSKDGHYCGRKCKHKDKAGDFCYLFHSMIPGATQPLRLCVCQQSEVSYE